MADPLFRLRRFLAELKRRKVYRVVLHEQAPRASAWRADLPSLSCLFSKCAARESNPKPTD